MSKTCRPRLWFRIRCVYDIVYDDDAQLSLYVSVHSCAVCCPYDPVRVLILIPAVVWAYQAAHASASVRFYLSNSECKNQFHPVPSPTASDQLL